MAMASGGRDLSNRMSVEAQNIDNSIERMALSFFKKHKLVISQAIRESYPLLQLLHDHDFITSEMYDVSKESFKKGHNVEEVVYDILVEVEKKFEPSLLKILFDEFTLKRNPGLNHIYESYKNAIADKTFFPESEAEENEMHGIQSSLKQVNISDDSAKCEDGDEPPKASTPAVKRKTGTGQQPDGSVNFQAELLPVTCKEMTGLLIKRRMERGATTKCIRKEEIHWFTPGEFKVRGGYKTPDNWKKILHCGGQTLEDLIEDEILREPPRKHGPNEKGGDSGKCKICQDEGKLIRCKKCLSFFHRDCHLPPVDPEKFERTKWNCTFCKIENSSVCQQRYREPEDLKKVIGSEEKLKCEFLLLKVYGPLETNIFPHENYIKQASRCLEKLRKLDKIKESLIKGDYTSVKSFVQAMDEFFTIPSCNDAELTQDDFKKNFKDIFAIEERN